MCMSDFTLNNESCSPYADVDYTIVAGLRAASGGVSFFMAFLPALVMVAFRQHTISTQILVLYYCAAASLSGFVTALQAIVYGLPDPSLFCIIAGFLEQHAGWSLMLSLLFLTIGLAIRAFIGDIRVRRKNTMAFLAFVAPLSFNWVPFLYHAYGRAGPWCWISDLQSADDKKNCTGYATGNLLRLALWHAPLCAISVLVAIAYVVTVVAVVRERTRWHGVVYDRIGDERRRDLHRKEFTLFVYPLVYAVASVPSVANRVRAYVAPLHPIFSLWVLEAILTPLAPGVIAMALTMDSGTCVKLKRGGLARAFQQVFKMDRKIENYPIAHISTSSVSYTSGLDAVSTCTSVH